MRPRVGTKGWAPLEVEQKDEKDKKERKKDAVVQNWCLTSRVPYKEGGDGGEKADHGRMCHDDYAKNLWYLRHLRVLSRHR